MSTLEYRQEQLKKALEFAEYMAKAVERYIETGQEMDKKVDELADNYSEINSQECSSSIELLEQKRSESFRALQSAIYEFRKRAEKAE